jgi:hypothetical protein
VVTRYSTLPNLRQVDVTSRASRCVETHRAEDAIIIGKIAFAATVSAALLLGNHAIAASSSYDGLWHVSIVTNKGECNSSYHYPIRIANGALSNADATGLAISGRVHDGGQVAVVVMSNKGRATGHGHLSGRSGAGRWHGEKCSGSWTAQRGSTGRITPY